MERNTKDDSGYAHRKQIRKQAKEPEEFDELSKTQSTQTKQGHVPRNQTRAFVEPWV